MADEQVAASGGDGKKRCTKCGETKPLSEFYRNGKYLRPDCCGCVKARVSDWTKNNTERRALYVKRYGQENKELRASRNREWRARNLARLAVYEALRYPKRKSDPDYQSNTRVNAKAWRVNNPQKTKQANKNYRLAHPDRINDKNRRHRSVKSNAPAIEAYSSLVIAERDGWRCHICGRKVKRREMSMDHLVPLSRGGEDTARNVALAHRICNSRRGAGRLSAQLRLLG